MLESLNAVRKERLQQAAAAVKDLAAQQLETAAGRELMHRAVGTRTVLAVAVEREGGWSAYIGSVPGKSHAREAVDVMRHGGRLRAEVARNIFPELSRKRYVQ